MTTARGEGFGGLRGRRRPRACPTLAATAFLLLAGCAIERPVHYYTLASAQPHESGERPDGPIMLVANIAADESLQDVRVRYRAGANEVGTYEYHHWNERPSVMVRNSLIQALRATGQYQRVLIASSSTGGDYLLSGRLHEFEEVDDPAIKTTISLHLELIDKKSNRMIWDHVFEREEPSAGKSIPDVVASMDRNLAQVAGQAAAQVTSAAKAGASR
jgi:cholesterol transport system auxiliary component